MCETCNFGGFNRREFLKVGGTAAVLGSLLPMGGLAFGSDNKGQQLTTKKKRTKVVVVFLYPPEEVVLAGKFEDANAPNKWSTWPGHQFEPENNQEKFSKKVKEFGDTHSIDLNFWENVYTKAQLAAFIEKMNVSPPDALLIFNFWNSTKEWAVEMTQKISVPTIVYQPLGVSHQLPTRYFMETPGIIYIHSLENWEMLENALIAVNAQRQMAQSRLLRVTQVNQSSSSIEKYLGTDVVIIPAEEYNSLFDSFSSSDSSLVREAMSFKAKAIKVLDVEDRYIIDGFRARKAILELVKRYDADGITILCLMLKERKPCLAFSVNNSALLPSACEDQWDSALAMMIGRHLFQRGCFQHNPDFDVNRNHYYASHCTCPLEMHGPGKGELPFLIRPFLHMLPKTGAVDVQFPPGEKCFLTRYTPWREEICTYTGTVVGSPAINVAAGCATRCILEVDKVDDVCSIYPGIHPLLYLGNKTEAIRMKMFAKLTKLKFVGNI